MHEIVLDGTPDGTTQSPTLPVLWILIYNVYLANFAEDASATGWKLDSVLNQLKDM